MPDASELRYGSQSVGGQGGIAWLKLPGGSVLTMMLLVSVVLGILPLLGIVWTILTGTIKSVDGLFVSLILLTLSGVFLLNAWWECRDCGYLKPAKKADADGAKKG